MKYQWKDRSGIFIVTELNEQYVSYTYISPNITQKATRHRQDFEDSCEPYDEFKDLKKLIKEAELCESLSD